MSGRRDFEHDGQSALFGDVHEMGSTDFTPTFAEQSRSMPELQDISLPFANDSTPSIPSENGVAQPDLQEYRSATLAQMHTRRQSTMSRLGSRILPNYVIRGLLNSEEETPAEGHAHRHGDIARSGTRSGSNAYGGSRLSTIGSLGARGMARRRSVARAPYYVPRNDSPSLSTYSLSGAERVSDPSRSSWRRSARLYRVRNSISTPISHMLGHNPPHPSAHSTSSGESENLPPLPVSLDGRMDTAEPQHELDAVDSAFQNSPVLSPIQSAQPGQGSGGVRRLPGLLRARSARVLRREEQTPLSRVLQLAATAIAAQLSGSTGPMMPNAQALGNGGLDGSLENFIQTLQNATSVQASPGDGSNSSENGQSQPVNFLRVFRFSNSDSPRASGMPGHQNSNAEGGILGASGSSSSSNGNDGEGMDVDDGPAGSEGRTVTLVVVGVRSVPAGSPRGNEPHGEAGPGLDALLGLPFLSSRNQEPSGQAADGRPRVPPRPFMGGSSGLFPNRESFRQQQRAVGSHWRPSDSSGGTPLSSSVPSDSPPGPHPPPSAPAESNASAGPSASAIPSRRLSAASVLPNVHESQPSSMQPTVESAPEESVPLRRSRQRRRSDSEYAGHRDLGAGAVRRNDMVEPDNSVPATGRSWLIYVVGTNLSENHPAFATPSLFTDVRPFFFFFFGFILIYAARTNIFYLESYL